VDHWKKFFSQLATLANGVIEDVPNMLSEAETMLFCIPP